MASKVKKRKLNNEICKSSGSQKNSQKKGTHLTDKQFGKQMSDTIVNLLRLNDSLRSLTRSQILSNFKKCRGEDAKQLIKAIKEVLDWNFGLQLIEAEEDKYIIVNKFGSENSSGKRSSDNVLLMLLLAAICINEHRIEEDLLIDHFSKLDIQMKNDPYFGDVQKQLQEFHRQMYIKKVIPESIADDDNQKTYYVKGKRTEYEIPNEVIMKHLSEVYGCSLEDIECLMVSKK